MLDKRDKDTIERMLVTHVEMMEWLVGEEESALRDTQSDTRRAELTEKVKTTRETLEYMQGLLRRYRAEKDTPRGRHTG